METQVNTIAIPALSVKVGYRPKKGNTSNCKKVANKNPLPTSIKLSIKLRTYPHIRYQTYLIDLPLCQIQPQIVAYKSYV